MSSSESYEGNPISSGDDELRQENISIKGISEDDHSSLPNLSTQLSLFVESCVQLPHIDESKWSGIYAILSLDKQQVRTDTVRPILAKRNSLRVPNIQESPISSSPNGFLFSSPVMAPILLQGQTNFANQDSSINTSTNQSSSQAVWNQEFIFDITKPLDNIHLLISVWGKDIHGDTSIIGSSRMELKELIKNYILKKSMKLNVAQNSPNQLNVMINDTMKDPIVNIRLIYKKQKNRVTENDFDKLKVIGKGSFGKVFQVKKKDTGRIYAMKVLTKDHVVRNNAVKYAMAENRVLKNINHPFIISLKYAFQTESHLYIVTDFLNGGEMFYHLSNDEVFPEDRARFYAAEIVSALSYLHDHQILYRDLKPENILFDMDGHICLVDFGLCKDGLGNDFKTHTFCGSAEYLAPELLLGKGYGKEFDWWSLGILIYEMISGLPPFWEEDEDRMQENILKAPLSFGPGFSEDAEDIIRKLLNRNPSERLGFGKNGSSNVKTHPWFRGICWDSLCRREFEPPFKPHIFDENDVKYVDEEILREPMSFANVKKGKIPIEEDVFAGFSYDGESEMFKYFQSKMNLLKISSENNPTSKLSIKTQSLDKIVEGKPTKSFVPSESSDLIFSLDHE